MQSYFFGIVEDRQDPLKLGRLRVRVAGVHTEVKEVGVGIPTEDLPWALTVQGVSGGDSVTPTGPAEGTSVLVSFIDPHKQIPIVLGVLPALPDTVPSTFYGFSDSRPEDVLNSAPAYPKAVTKGAPGVGVAITEQSPKPLNPKFLESTVNRLARGVESTIQATKTSMVKPVVPAAMGAVWSEKPSPYAPKYPYNFSFISESGHGYEFDDTPGAERLHWFHRAGSFHEIHPNGDSVTKTTGDKYELVFKNAMINTEGYHWVTVNKGMKLFVNSDAGGQSLEIEVGATGNLNIIVQKGDCNLTVNGNLITTIAGDHMETILGDVVRNITGSVTEVVLGARTTQVAASTEVVLGTVDRTTGGNILESVAGNRVDTIGGQRVLITPEVIVDSPKVPWRLA